MMKNRNPFWAGLFTIGTLGLGQLYNGKPVKAVVMYCLPFICLILNLLFPISAGFSFLVVFEALLLSILLFSIIDAVRDARKLKVTPLRPYNRWYVYIAILLIHAFLIIPLQMKLFTHPSKAFRIPAGSMMPTIEIGDRLIADMRIYNKILPARGDIVVFKYPPDESILYVKRVIGLPGEKLEMIGRVVYINGHAMKESYTQYIDPGSINEHFGPYSVPQDRYFVLGDNRDNSQDSRFWGYVSQSKIIGQARYLYWANNKSRIGKRLE
jgi:signal peptidase I